MTDRLQGSDIEFNRHAVRPIECFREGWRLIKDDYWLFFGITFVGLLIAGVFAPLLLGPMWCGIDICLLRRLNGRQVRLSNLFEGFNFFGPSVVCTQLSQRIAAAGFIVSVQNAAQTAVCLLAPKCPTLRRNETRDTVTT
jgi:hypothetical protein